jgi:fatty-acyl-CoA synthase
LSGRGEGDSLKAESVTNHCRARLAGFKIPGTIHFRYQPLPRTPTGKVQKFILVERLPAK